jgi:hypothetical protein
MKLSSLFKAAAIGAIAYPSANFLIAWGYFYCAFNHHPLCNEVVWTYRHFFPDESIGHFSGVPFIIVDLCIGFLIGALVALAINFVGKVARSFSNHQNNSNASTLR